MRLDGVCERRSRRPQPCRCRACCQGCQQRDGLAVFRPAGSETGAVGSLSEPSGLDLSGLDAWRQLRERSSPVSYWMHHD